MTKKTLVLGASTNPSRYSFLATEMLTKRDIPVVLVGNKAGKIFGNEIQTEWPTDDDIDTITLYVASRNQDIFYHKILSSHAKRIIFNPGTENVELAQKCADAGIEPVLACTLVLLSTNQY